MPQDLPDFEKPPVTEVVCGVQFKELRSLIIPHLGQLWEKFKAEYPRYQEVSPIVPVIELFKRHLSSFEDFVEEAPLGSIEPVQYEMTYVNLIPQDEGWSSLKELRKVFPDFAWQNKPRFLPEAEVINWRTSYVLPKQAGRLHTTIRNGTRADDNSPIVRFELTARGMPADTSKDAMWQWFALDHEWIVKGFEDLTGSTMHKNVWKKRK
jgi:hypothetical protein